LIDPLRVVDRADEPVLGGEVSEEGQAREPDEEPIGRRVHTQSECGAERAALWRR
jgi:hypothetical protein